MNEIYEYKVIDVRDKFGKVNIEKLSDILNQYGKQGWHLVTAYTNELGKNALIAGGIGINATADQNILILERKISKKDNNETSVHEKVVSEEDKKQERFNWISNNENKQTVIEYIQTQLEKNDLSEIYKFQELYFNTSSLAFMKEIVPDVTSFNNIDDYKTELQKIKL